MSSKRHLVAVLGFMTSLALVQVIFSFCQFGFEPVHTEVPRRHENLEKLSGSCPTHQPIRINEDDPPPRDNIDENRNSMHCHRKSRALLPLATRGP